MSFVVDYTHRQKNDSSRYALCGNASTKMSIGSSDTTERSTDGPKRPTTPAASRYWRPSDNSIRRRNTCRGLVKPSRPSRDGPLIRSRLSAIFAFTYRFSLIASSTSLTYRWEFCKYRQKKKMLKFSVKFPLSRHTAAQTNCFSFGAALISNLWPIKNDQTPTTMANKQTKWIIRRVNELRPLRFQVQCTWKRSNRFVYVRLVVSVDLILCPVTLFVHTICINLKAYTQSRAVSVRRPTENVKRNNKKERNKNQIELETQLERSAARCEKMRIWIVIRIICQDSKMTAHCMVFCLMLLYIDDRHHHHHRRVVSHRCWRAIVQAFHISICMVISY